MDVPIESARKYGDVNDWFDASDEFASALSGNPVPVRNSGPSGVPAPEGDEDDASNVLRDAFNLSRKLGIDPPR